MANMKSGSASVPFKGGIIGLLLRFASGLRFPVLFAVTALLFVVDLIVPDVIPFVDEILLGLLTLILASRRDRTLSSDGSSDQ